MKSITFAKILGVASTTVLWIASLLSIIVVGVVDGITLMPVLAKVAVSLTVALLLILRMMFRSSGIAAGLTTVGILLMTPVTIWLSQSLAYTPSIVDEQGKVLPNSIASLEKIQLGGTDQWVVIRGKDRNNPVLLYLSGGPGGSELGWLRQYNPELENHFVVVVWEQPGAGKSYAARSYDTLTVEQYVSDGNELAEILRERFHQDKIYVLGSSWGTILGVKMVQQQPDLFYAYMGMGQMVATEENDLMSYAYALEIAQQKGDQKAAAAISKNGPPPYSGKGASLKYSNYINYVNAYDTELSGSHLEGNFMLAALRTPEFGLIDQVNFFRGLIEGMDKVYVGQLDDLSLDDQASKLDVPVYLFESKFDHNANYVLAERWFNRLDAPHKEIFWFDASAHSPCFTEPEEFNQLVLENVVVPR